MIIRRIPIKSPRDPDCCDAMIRCFNAPDAIEWADEESGWSIPGCCGGGCYVMEQMIYCPFCGSEMPKLEEDRRLIAGKTEITKT
mgnify:CR=1 FL=1